MRSPTSGREMESKTEQRSLDYHGQSFTIDYSFYWCDVTGKEYVSKLQDKNNHKQLHEKYCKKNKLFLPGQIGGLREKYGMSYNDFSVLLGISLINYTNLEIGLVIPTGVNEKLTNFKDPKYFFEILRKHTNLKNYSKIEKKVLKELYKILPPEEYSKYAEIPFDPKQIEHQKYWAKYIIPNDLTKLLLLGNREDFDTDTIGFKLDLGNQSYFGPVDFMVFGYSGGDGGLFGFLTDFGYYTDLNEAPILFSVRIDFWYEHPSYSIKLIAANFRDFLRLMITMWSAEMLRTYSVFSVDYDVEIPQCRKELKEYDHELRLSTIKIIKEEFGIEEIPDVEAYFLKIYGERKNNADYVELIDGLGINFRNVDAKKLKEDYLSIKSNDDPAVLLQQLNSNQKKMFLREDDFTYYRQDDYSSLYRYQTYFDHLKYELSPNEVMNLEFMIELQKTI